MCRSPKTLRDRIGNHRTETALGFRQTRPLVHCLRYSLLHRKEVIHPHVLVGIPCYDLTPITSPTFDGSFLAVRPPASGIASSHGMTGGVYKARERIHRGMLIRDY